jgi:hypothetical protein
VELDRDLVARSALVVRELSLRGSRNGFLAEDRATGRRARVLPLDRWELESVGVVERAVSTFGRLRDARVGNLYRTGPLPDGGRYVATHLVEGVRLEAWCATRRAGLRVAAVVGLARLVEEASRGVGPFLFDPRDVLVAETGEVRLEDVGLRDLFRWFGRLALKPEETTPEEVQLDALEVLDRRANHGPRGLVWTCGVVLFRLLTGASPYAGATTRAVLQAMLREPPRSALALEPRIPAGLADVLSRCLRREPGERFAGPTELAEALLPWSG